MNTKRYIIGNWKMHGSIEHMQTFFDAFNRVLLQSSVREHVETAICPPFVYLPWLLRNKAEFAAVQYGAQDVSAHQLGAFTGQISASMLTEFECRYVIVGHSERRQFCHETDEEIAAKFLAAKAAGLRPILCVGETRSEREAGETEEVVKRQLTYLLDKHSAPVFDGALVAYEPIWAIGTGLSATPVEAQKVHALLRATIAEYDSQVAQQLPILYGGSVKASSAPGLFAMPDINGALVGGASLNVSDFWGICEAIEKV